MYKLLCEDSLTAMKEMADETFDLFLSDPPYMNYVTGHRKNKKDKLSQSLVQQSREEQLETVREGIRLLKQDKAFYFFTSWAEMWWFQSKFVTHLRNCIIWDKGNWTAGDLKGSFGNKYEVIFLGAKGKWEYSGTRLPDIWEIPRVGTKRIHSTEKPVDLYKRIIEISTNEGDWILDSHAGSGASIIAALELNRHILAYDIDPEYCERIERRVKEWQEI